MALLLVGAIEDQIRGNIFLSQTVRLGRLVRRAPAPARVGLPTDEQANEKETYPVRFK